MYRVYEYGVTRINSGWEWAREQMRLRAVHWNRLVECERRYRDRMDEALEQHSPDLASVNSREREIDKTIEDAAPSVRRSLRESHSAELRTIYTKQAALRKPLLKTDAVKASLADLEKQRRDEAREARHVSAAEGLWWGNYLDVEEAYNTARKRFGRQLRWHHPGDENTVSVWFQQGLPLPALWGGDGADSRLGLEPVPATAWDSAVRGERRRLSRTNGRIRVGSNPDKTPRYVTFELVAHRRIDPGLVRHASLVHEQIGTIHRYKLLLTVDVGEVVQHPEYAEHRVGVDIGWRRLPNGDLRVAHDSRGCTCADGLCQSDYRLPARMVEAFSKCDAIRGHRDDLLNEMKARLSAFRKSPAGSGAPVEWRDKTQYAHQWRSAAQAQRLFNWWSNNRFADDAEMFNCGTLHDKDNSVACCLTGFVRRDRHLWDYEANMRDEAVRERREYFRRWALQMAKQKAEICLEKFDLRGVIGTKAAEGDLQMVEDAAQHLRVVAGVSILRDVIKTTAAREGVPVTERKAEWTTQRCHNCADLQRFDARREIRHVCTGCGQEWDQDYNAAVNLTKRD